MAAKRIVCGSVVKHKKTGEVGLIVKLKGMTKNYGFDKALVEWEKYNKPNGWVRMKDLKAI